MYEVSCLERLAPAATWILAACQLPIRALLNFLSFGGSLVRTLVVSSNIVTQSHVMAILQVPDRSTTGHGAGQRAAAARHPCQVPARTTAHSQYLSAGVLQLLASTVAWILHHATFALHRVRRWKLRLAAINFC